MHNWSGHVEFSSAALLAPATVAELQSLVAHADRIRAIGTAHSFNDLADTTGVHVSVAGLAQDIEVDESGGSAWIPAGMRYGDAARILDSRGLAFHNMASLGHISVGGSAATGTHGSGDRNPSLSASVVGLELVTASGDVLNLGSDGDRELLNGAVVSLGALGVVTRVGVRVQPRFEIEQFVIDSVGHDMLLERFDGIFSSAYSVSFFTTWLPSLVGQVWMKRRVGVDAPWPDERWPEEPWMGGTAADGKRHPLPGHDAVNCTDQGGMAGPWHERLPHFRLDFTPSSGDELQTEYLVPRSEAVGLLRELETMAPRIAPLLYISEIRTMCADDLWLSGASGRDTVGIHFTWHKDLRVLELLPDLDALLGPSGGRPHWGKLYSAPRGAIAARYPRFDLFVDLADRMDPSRKFRNPTLDALLDER